MPSELYQNKKITAGFVVSLLTTRLKQRGYSLTLFSDYDTYPLSLPNFFETLGTVAQSVEQRTENPRVGGSIPSRPTFLNPLKLGTYRHFVSIFFYFSSAEFHWTSPNGPAVSSWFTVILSTQSVQNLYKTAFGFYRFHVNSRTWLGRFGDVCGVVL